MTVATQELYSKMVRSELLDLESRSQYLSDLWQDEGPGLGQGHSIDIGEVSDSLAPEDAIDSSYDNVDLTVQTIASTVNNLVVDQARALAREVPTFHDLFGLGAPGRWAAKIAPKLQTKLRNDRDDKDIDYLIRNILATLGSTTTYYQNVAAAAITKPMIGNAVAQMENQEGVLESDLAWFFNPYGSGSVKQLPTWEASKEVMDGRVGIGRLGFLEDIPVYKSSTVPRSLAVSCTGVVVGGGVATFTVLAANQPHGMVAGMKIWSQETSAGTTWDNAAGDDIPQATPIAINASGLVAGAIPVTYGGTGATDAAAVITLTVDACFNMLVNRSWLWQATALGRIATRIIPYGRTRISDVLQAFTIWGRRSRAGACIAILSPTGSVT